jgi:propionyl-CoA synthetase
VVFGGFASVSLARRIDDARPRLIVSADAGSRAGKVIEYKPLLDQAIELAETKPAHVLLVNRGLAAMQLQAGRDVDWAALRSRHLDSDVPVTWLESNEPSYILYTSGTTGKPKGVQRDVGGYAVALAASMRHIYDCQPGETYFCTSDIGWVVGHSYIVYGPLINGMTTLLYEGTPLRPDAGIFWQLVAKHRPAVMFSSPTAIRTLKRYDQTLIRQHDISSLRALFLAGEPLDEPTARWVGEWLGCPIRDNYWQTETGWPIMATPAGADPHYGSAGQPVFGYDVRLVSEADGEPLDTTIGEIKKGVVAIAPPLPPGCLQTVWDDDERFVRTYFHSIPGKLLYSTFDWGTRDRDGYWYILGRIDDVINVAGHRLGTREIEESICCHAAVAECAVVGVHDAVKGQVAVAFAVLRNPDSIRDSAMRMELEGAVMKLVHEQLGAVARPARVHFVTGLPKTRSGKVLRRAIQAVCERRDPGDLTTIDDPGPLEQVKQAHLGQS